MKHLLTAVAAAGLLAGCGATAGASPLAPATPTVQVFTAVQVSNGLTFAMESNPDYRGMLRDTPSCDSALKKIGDVSLCTATVEGPGYSGKYVISVTLKDGNGHILWNINHPVN